jgi:hypothetical protein
MHFGCGGKPASKNRMNQELSDFAARLREIMLSEGRVIRGPDLKDEDGDSCNSALRNFGALALELFALQLKHNAAYRRFCEAQEVKPGVIEHWTQIPAVPTAAFKESELSCIPSEERTAVFHSSGTTEQRPGRHFHGAESLEMYETSLWSWFAQNVLPDLRFTIYDLRLICLSPPPEQAPHSSLVRMFETVRNKLDAEFGVPPSGGRVNAELQTRPANNPLVYLGKVDRDGSWTLDFDAVLAALNSSLATRHPSLILGTAFSFVHLLDFLGERNLRFRLPPGSRVMETGGYKNRSRTMPKDELHALITEWLGVASENIICEYGMSELSSQAYALGALASRRRVSANETTKLAGWKPAPPGHFQFPPWARVQIISPETGQEVAEGETGLIRIFDLANVFSAMAVQTEDLGVRRGDGFELIGRAQFAEPRGCSLMMEGSASSLP